MLRKAQDALPGDVYTESNGRWNVLDVSITAEAVQLLLAMGRTDSGSWFDFKPDQMLDLWRAEEDSRVPQSVIAALAAHREVLQAERAAERLRQAERRAIINMATDEAYSHDWQEHYHGQIDEIDKKFKLSQDYRQ